MFQHPSHTNSHNAPALAAFRCTIGVLCCAFVSSGLEYRGDSIARAESYDCQRVSTERVADKTEESETDFVLHVTEHVNEGLKVQIDELAMRRTRDDVEQDQHPAATVEAIESLRVQAIRDGKGLLQELRYHTDSKNVRHRESLRTTPTECCR